MLKVGDAAPNFTIKDHAGAEVSLSDLRDSKVWLWFYTSPGGNN
jgi:peroxiredoxin